MPRVRIKYSFEEPDYIKLWIRWISLTAAALCFGWGGFVWLERTWYQTAAEESFEELKTIEAPVEPARPKKPAATPMAQFEIARLHVSGYVEDGFDSRTLRRAIGHSPHSAKPGQPGNVILAAHRDTFFSGLKDVQVGDIAELKAAGGKRYQYKVSKILVVDPEDVWILKNTPQQSRLTLITCYPFHFIGSAPKRFVVQAEPVDTGIAAKDLSLSAHRL